MHEWMDGWSIHALNTSKPAVSFTASSHKFWTTQSSNIPDSKMSLLMQLYGWVKLQALVSNR